jgi:hypothetical protein
MGKAVEKNKAASKTVQDRAEKLMEQGRKLGAEADRVAVVRRSEKRSEVDLESGVTPLEIRHPLALVQVSATNMEVRDVLRRDALLHTCCKMLI